MGGLKKCKNGGDPYGFYLVFAFRNFVVFIQRILNFVVPLSLFYVPGDFLSYSALFYSQSMSDQFSAHIRLVIQCEYIIITLIYNE